MNAAIPMHLERDEPGILGPLALAVFVHLLLFAVLFIGVRWQSRPPAPVTVELWSPPPIAVKPEVKPEIKPEVKPEPRMEPPPKPEPRIEPPKPAIAVPEKPRPKPKPKPEPKPEPKPKPEAVKPAPPKPRDLEAQKRLREDIARAQNELKREQESAMIKDQLMREQAALKSNALAAYTDKIKAKIKGNILLPLDIKGNPEAIFDVVQLPTGEVLTVRLRKSSGHRGYDTAVERAILKSSPLPKPEKGELFARELSLKFRPHD